MGGGGGGGVDSPSTYQSLDKNNNNNRKMEESQRKRGKGGLCVEESLLGQFVGGIKVVAGPIHGRNKRKKEKKGK